MALLPPFIAFDLSIQVKVPPSGQRGSTNAQILSDLIVFRSRAKVLRQIFKYTADQTIYVLRLQNFYAKFSMSVCPLCIFKGQTFDLNSAHVPLASNA